VSHAAAAIGMHDKFWDPVARKLRDGALVCVNDATFEAPLDLDRYRVVRVPATDVAADLGTPMAGSMVMAAAFASLSGLVGREALREGMRASIPPYRAQHVEANEIALAAGHDWAAARSAEARS
jgi:Pyruvate/2-oxoacid:ferredoxin oxidoreductase gamma subunit